MTTVMYTMSIDKWGDITVIKNLTKQQVIDITLGEPYKENKYLNSIITIEDQETGDTQHIDTTDDFELFGIEFAPGF